MARTTPGVRTYEARLHADLEWSMAEGTRFFRGESELDKALEEIGRRLDDLGVAYAIVGGLALSAHGFRRLTEDIDILVTPEGHRLIQQNLVGRGYLPPFRGSKNLRDTVHRVKIEFLLSGSFPGDGRPKPVAFPDPAAVAVRIGEISYVNLPTLIELKLASGMTDPGRLKDLADVGELVKTLRLPIELSEQLHDYVREKFSEIWRSMAASRRRFVRVWRNRLLTLDAKTLGEMASILRAASEELDAMLRDGVTLDPEGGTGDDDALLVTYDPEVARRYGLEDEDALWDAGEE